MRYPVNTSGRHLVVLNGGVILDGCYGWWRHNEGSGTVLADSRGLRDGAIVGANFWANKSPDGSPCGTYDGTTNYINGIGQDLGRSNGNSLTVMMAVNTAVVNDAGGFHQMMARFQGTDGANYLLMLVQSTDEIALQSKLIPAISVRYQTTAFNMAINTWYILTFKYTFAVGNTAKIYVNGEGEAASWVMGDGDGTPDYNATGYTLIGSVDNSAVPDDVGDTQFWNGKIGDVLWYNRLLSDAEVLRNFNALRGRYGL